MTSLSSERSRVAVGRLLLAIVITLAGCRGGGGGPDPVDGGPHPCTAGSANCSCRSDESCNSGLVCDGSTCITCQAGQDGCACRSNATCDSGLLCAASSICMPCTAGAESCSCRSDGTCGGALECRGGHCVPGASCAEATLGCACTTAGACQGGLTCASGICRGCASDVPGCACDANASCEGLVCDAGTCRTSRTCAETCAPGQQCTAGSPTTDAVCLESCQAGYLWNPAARRCDPSNTICPACSGPGEDGVWPALTQGGRCICKTRPGYFYTLSGLVGTYPCDADQDGWVRSTAWYALTNTDWAIRENARCDLRTIDTIVLHNDQGQQRPLALGEVLPLYETVRNDDQDALDLDSGSGAVPPYGENDGRSLRATELNSLTKACVSERADHNDNQLADISEWGRPTFDSAGRSLPSSGQAAPPGPGAFPGALTHALELYTRWSYFVELDRGWYEPGAAGKPGLYHIAEKDRSIGAGFPLQYGTEASDYWRDCLRGRDIWYSDSSPPIGMDFASVSEPNRDWKGMGHSSQFKCVQVVDDATFKDPDSAGSRYLQSVAQLGDPLKDAKASDFLRAMMNTCAVDSGTGRPGSGKNPTDPVIRCNAKLPSNDYLGGVYWAAVRLTNTTNYDRGCILQCNGFAYLCPGSSPTESPRPCYHLCGDLAASERKDLVGSGGFKLRGEVPATTPVAGGSIADQVKGYRITPR